MIYEPGEKLQKRALGEWMVLTILLPGSLSGRCQATGARRNPRRSGLPGHLQGLTAGLWRFRQGIYIALRVLYTLLCRFLARFARCFYRAPKRNSSNVTENRDDSSVAQQSISLDEVGANPAKSSEVPFQTAIPPQVPGSP